MSAKGIIVFRTQDQQISEPYLEKLTKNNHNCFGLVMPSPHEKGKLLLSRVTEAMPLEGLKELQETFKAQPCLMFFGEYPKGYLQEDLQPFSVLRLNEEDTMVAFLEGDFSNCIQKGSSHIPEFFAANQIQLKLDQMYRLTNHNLDKVVAELKTGSLTAKELSSLGLKRNVVAVMAANKDFSVRVFQKDNSDHGNFPWGWTSNALGYKEGEFPAKEEQQSTLSKLIPGIIKFKPKLKAQAPEPVKEPEVPFNPPFVEKPVVEEPAKEPEVKKPPKQKLSSKIKQVSSTKPIEATKSKEELKTSTTQRESIYYSAPMTMSNNQKRQDYLEKVGYCPQGYKRSPKVEVPENFLHLHIDPKDLKSLKTVVAVKQKQAEENKGVTDEILPLIPPKQVEPVTEVLLKALDSNSNRISDPEKMQDEETKYPSFAEVYGLKDIGELKNLRYEAYRDIALKGPDAAGVLLLNCFQHIIKLEAQVSKSAKISPTLKVKAAM